MTAQISDSLLIDGTMHALCVLPLDLLFKSMPDRTYFEWETTANWRGYVALWKIENQQLWLAGLNGRVKAERPSSIESGFAKPIRDAKEKHRILVHHNVARIGALVAEIEALPEGQTGIRQSVKEWPGSLISEHNGHVDYNLAIKAKGDDLLNSHISPVPASWYSGLLRVPVGKVLNYVHSGFHTEYESDLVIEIAAGAVGRRWMIDNRSGYEIRKQANEATSAFDPAPFGLFESLGKWFLARRGQR
jgi:hypothetical protein